MSEKTDTKVKDSFEQNRRKVVIVENSIETEVYSDKWFCAYVQIREDEDAYKIATSDPLDLPVEAPGGFTYSGWGYPAVDLENRFYVGWDYNHAWNGDETLDDVREQAKEVAEQMSEVTLKEAAREKLSRQPEWFQKGVRELFQ